ncbi:MAG TPA: ABC transporter ATP-binding protein, partial [Candidatus Methylomirabilis sp.]|nr:ABC transporter ATP-binding protein [Candidatus Methylomirabilis sp.]
MSRSLGELMEKADRRPMGRGDELALSVRGVGKVYRLYDRPQDRLKHMLLSRFGRAYGREFWALRDVSFDVRRGEALGIIGRNGSGKSTLLQIMAGILQPAAGQVRINGRVGALLELGSGFNPDCTGRENIITNGAILGVPRADIEARLDEIAAFADIGEFIDQPVKTLSSGMFVRLAFSVTTSLDADVLLIDEALAVGDVFFRQKCYQRLEALRARGVSIVLVSHAMTEVEQFCQRAVLLDGGRALFQGSATEAVKRYYLVQPSPALAVDAAGPSPGPGTASEWPGGRGSRWPHEEALLDLSSVAQISSGRARYTSVALCDGAGRARQAFEQGETASFFYEVELLDDVEVPTGGVELVNDKGIIVHGKTTLEYGSPAPEGARRGARLRFRQDIQLDLAAGEYTFNVGVATLGRRDYEERSSRSHAELDARMIRLCLLPTAGAFAVLFRSGGTPVQL